MPPTPAPGSAGGRFMDGPDRRRARAVSCAPACVAVMEQSAHGVSRGADGGQKAPERTARAGTRAGRRGDCRPLWVQAVAEEAPWVRCYEAGTGDANAEHPRRDTLSPWAGRGGTCLGGPIRKRGRAAQRERRAWRPFGVGVAGVAGYRAGKPRGPLRQKAALRQASEGARLCQPWGWTGASAPSPPGSAPPWLAGAWAVRGPGVQEGCLRARSGTVLARTKGRKCRVCSGTSRPKPKGTGTDSGARPRCRVKGVLGGRGSGENAGSPQPGSAVATTVGWNENRCGAERGGAGLGAPGYGAKSQRGALRRRGARWRRVERGRCATTQIKFCHDRGGGTRVDAQSAGVGAAGHSARSGWRGHDETWVPGTGWLGADRADRRGSTWRLVATAEG